MMNETPTPSLHPVHSRFLPPRPSELRRRFFPRMEKIRKVIFRLEKDLNTMTSDLASARKKFHQWSMTDGR